MCAVKSWVSRQTAGSLPTATGTFRTFMRYFTLMPVTAILLHLITVHGAADVAMGEVTQPAEVWKKYHVPRSHFPQRRWFPYTCVLLEHSCSTVGMAYLFMTPSINWVSPWPYEGLNERIALCRAYQPSCAILAGRSQ